MFSAGAARYGGTLALRVLSAPTMSFLSRMDARDDRSDVGAWPPYKTAGRDLALVRPLADPNDGL